MKKFTLMVLVLCLGLAHTVAEPYFVRVNGTDDYPAENTGEQDYQGRVQYKASPIPLKAGDVITVYDQGSDASWAIGNLDPYGAHQNFSASVDGVTCNVAGCYNIYVKMKYQDDILYIEEAEGCAPTTDPKVSLSIPSTANVNEPINLNATAENLDNPNFVYSVKVPGSATFESINGNTYTPTVAGTYTFKAEAMSDGAAVASDEKTVIVKDPSTGEGEVVVKVQIPTEGLSEWTAEGGVYFYVWTTADGVFTQATAEDDGWYSYSAETVPFNFIVVNGGSWDVIAGDVRRQSIDMMNVTESVCYVMVNGGETDGQDNWKKELNITECPEVPSDLIQETADMQLFTVNGRTLNVSMDNEAEISIYTISGQMIEHTVASNFTREMQQGVYVIRIGNQSQKLVIF